MDIVSDDEDHLIFSNKMYHKKSKYFFGHISSFIFQYFFDFDFIRGECLFGSQTKAMNIISNADYKKNTILKLSML